MTRDAVRKAYMYAVEAGLRPVLVGTAGLWLRGYAVDPPDIDFLVARDVGSNRYGEAGERFDGITAHYIGAQAGTGRTAYYHPEHADLVDDVLVATTKDILGLKRWLGREKDREFLRGWDAAASRPAP